MNEQEDKHWLTYCKDLISSGGELMSCLLAAAPADKLDPSALTREELVALTKAHARARVIAATQLKSDNPKEWLTAANLHEGLSMFTALLRPTRSLVPGFQEINQEAQAALLMWLRKKFNHNIPVLNQILEALHEDGKENESALGSSSPQSAAVGSSSRQ